MSEALQAKSEIAKALVEFGSDIIYKKITKGTYNPLTGDTTDTFTDIPMKAFVKKQATEETERAFTGDYERSIVIVSDFEPSKDDRISFKGIIYVINYIAPSTLQNIDFKYEILIKR